ncbi:hypothetical protein FA95DRAFT_673355 [Auriscalpium vulgare]|uniref:Uncharacterized protein n=1 Tax=Auriscalpium vulgare TaxID=40419 RepID=A0ACB8RCP4_9AGAM|nr:hypothetical protein FA95DRAFT_673355 [Auriscalpium vulgare]
MGGFHFYEKGKPKHPLDSDNVITLLRDGELILPTEDEIQALGHADSLSKGLSVLQTMWFIVQCIARRAEGLPITQLEIMTLAYTTITVAMYAAWWSKPLNVGIPIRFDGKLSGGHTGVVTTRMRHYAKVVMGAQDDEVNMRSVSHVPAFYGGDWTDDQFVNAGGISISAMLIFGAIHCIAWNYIFPSHAEATVWRVSSVTITALPGLFFLVFMPLLFAFNYAPDSWHHKAIGRALLSAMPLPFSIVYVLTRLVLFVLAFSTLRALPAAAYQSVQWTHFIPHLT